MKLLLDESVDRRLARHLPPPAFSVDTVAGIGWASTGNGLLISRAATAGYEALITRDGGIAYQQNLDHLPLPVVFLDAFRNGMEYLEPLVPELIDLLRSPLHNRVYIVPRPLQT